jgi:hypothetical protein
MLLFMFWYCLVFQGWLFFKVFIYIKYIKIIFLFYFLKSIFNISKYIKWLKKYKKSNYVALKKKKLNF